MSGDVHVQFCERPGVRFPRATHLALFADDPARLAAWRDRAAAFLAKRRLSLHPAKTHVAATSAPATFLGFELRPGGRRRLPESNVRRFRNRLRGLRDRWRAGTVTRREVEQRVGAWVAHAAHADTWRLRRAIADVLTAVSAAGTRLTWRMLGIAGLVIAARRLLG